VGHPEEAGSGGIGRLGPGADRDAVRLCCRRRPEITDFDAGPMGPRRRCAAAPVDPGSGD
jgi:hypothetical protein